MVLKMSVRPEVEVRKRDESVVLLPKETHVKLQDLNGDPTPLNFSSAFHRTHSAAVSDFDTLVVKEFDDDDDDDDFTMGNPISTAQEGIRSSELLDTR